MSQYNINSFIMEYKLQIKKYRNIRNMTQAELARKSGVRQSYISQLERNSANAKSPTLKVIFNIAEALEVCPHVLVISNIKCNENCCHNCRQIF